MDSKKRIETVNMSLETRSNSALFKRAEQLKRWEESDTNREPVSPKHKSRRVKFSSGCVFLAACAAGDKEEVLKLLEKGADINTANVDGLTALHQVPHKKIQARPPVAKASVYDVKVLNMAATAVSYFILKNFADKNCTRFLKYL